MSSQILKLEKYLILERIAVGGMAEVYLAKTISSDKFLAIKKMLPANSTNLQSLTLFKEEIRVSLNLSHGNIVSFVDFIFERGELYLIMEFVNGVNLRQFGNDLDFTKTKIKTEHAVFIAAEIASGLDYAHRSVDLITHQKLNIIHRDINPNNIMITFDGGVKIIDFGVARADTRMDVTKVGMLKGKFSYMSPEQVDCGEIDSRTDIFALGIILWELVTNQRLFKDKNEFQVLTKIKNDPIPSPRQFDPDLSEEITRIILKALEKDPNKRYQTAADIKFDLEQILAKDFPIFRRVNFSDLITNIYQDIIIARSEKLRALLKVKVENDDVPNSKKRNKSIVTEFSKSKSQAELPEGFHTQTMTKVADNFNFGVLDAKNPFAAEVKVFTKQKASNFFTNDNNASFENPKDEKFFLSNFKHLFMIIVCLYATASLYKQYFRGEKAGPATAAVQASSADSTATASENSFAARVVASKTEDFSADVYRRLKESSKLAYVNISVNNSTSKDVRIFLNGKELLQKSPIRMFAVYADQVTRITAYNAKQNTTDEKKITVQAGKTVNVTLDMRPYGSR